MNGNNFLFDTNAIILFLKGDLTLFRYYQECDDLYISVISYIEYMSFSNLTKYDISIFENFANEANILNIEFGNKSLLKEIISLRSEKLLKIPDTIIAAQAIQNQITLITKDKQFLKIPKLKVIVPY